MENLDDYTLLEIFKNLDASSMKECSLVCKRFNQLISTSAQTMKTFKLRLNFNCNYDDFEFYSDRFSELRTLKRFHYTLSIDEEFIEYMCDYSRYDDERIMQKLVISLKNQGKYLRVLEIFDVTEVLDSNLLKNLLKNLKVLEKLVLNNSRVDLIMDYWEKSQAVDVPSLKSLIFEDSNWEFFYIIGKTQLQELKIYHEQFDERDSKYISPFFSRQCCLESLALRVNNVKFYKLLSNNDDFKKYPFRLKKLSCIDSGWSKSKECDKALIDFLKVHKETLEHLETDRKLSHAIYYFIFNSLKLKSMVINAAVIHNNDENDSIFGFGENLHMKKLILLGKIRDFAAVQGLLSVYRSVEELRIDDLSESIANNVMTFIIYNLTKLSHLKIPFIHDDPPQLAIESLKSLAIECIDSVDNFESFVSHQINLEKLTLECIIQENSSEEIAIAVANLHKLERIIFGPGFMPSNHILESIKENCPKIKYLEYTKSNQLVSADILNRSDLRVHEYTYDSSVERFKSHTTMWEDEDYAIDPDWSYDEDEEMLANSEDDDEYMSDDSDDEEEESLGESNYKDSFDFSRFDHLFF